MNVKITKKEFINKYPTMRLAGVINRPLDEVLSIINKAPKATIENTRETSRYDIDTCKKIGKEVTIHQYANIHNLYYIVYTVLDNSKDNNTSRNNILHECVVYVVLGM